MRDQKNFLISNILSAISLVILPMGNIFKKAFYAAKTLEKTFKS